MSKYARFTPTHLSLGALALAIATAAGSAIAADTTANTSATVVAPISIAKVSDLSFGSFAAGSGAGTVTISTNGARTSSGVVEMGGAPGAAEFDVTGNNGQAFTLSVTPTVLTNTTGSGGETMTFTPISTLTPTAATSGTVAGGTVGAGTKVYVGGSLAVSANQVAGAYTGTVAVTVNYG